MKGRRRAVVTAGLALALPLALLMSPGAFAASAHAADTTAPSVVAAADPNTPGSQSLAACLQGARSLSALFVLDASGSLEGTDPQGIRFLGLQNALNALTRLSDARGGKLAVDAAVAAFDDGYLPAARVVPWVRLGGEDGQETIRDVVEKARERANTGGGTDFEKAVKGGAGDLSRRGGPGTCRALLWFTDGLWEASSTTPDQASAALCARGGFFDELRRQDITLVALALVNDTVRQALADPANAGRVGEMESMARGRDGSRICGTVPIPEGSSSGIYLRASDAGGLRRLFGSVGSILDGCSPTGTLGTVVDPGIRRFRVNLTTTEPASSIRLDGPGGESFVAPTSGGYEWNGYRTDASQDEEFVSLAVELPASRGVGRWTVSADKPIDPGSVEFCVYSGLSLQLAGTRPGPSLAAGSPGEQLVQVVDGEGKPASLSPYKTAVPGASAVGPDGKPRKTTAKVSDAAAGVIAVALQPGFTDPRLDLAVRVGLTTRSGVALTPLSGRWGIPVTLSKEFPVVTPADALKIGDVRNLEPGVGTLTLTGSPVGPTQVCFGAPSDVVVPEDAPGTAIDYPQGCIDLAPTESREVQVRVVPDSATDGVGSAVIPITLVSAATAGKKAVKAELPLPAEWLQERPLAIATLLWALLLIVLASVLLPWAAILLANWLTARYDVHRLQVAEVPVRIQGGVPVRLGEPVPGDPRAILDPAEFQTLYPLGTRRSLVPGMWRRPVSRRFTVAGVELRSTTPWDPFRSPSFFATVPPGHRLVSNVGSAPLHDGRWAETAPGLGFLWLVVFPDAELTGGDEPEGSLLVLMREDTADFAAFDVRIRTDVSWGTCLAALKQTAASSSVPVGVVAAGGGESQTPPNPWIVSDDDGGGDEAPPRPDDYWT